MHAMTPADAIVCDGLPIGFRTGTMQQINRNEFHFHQPMVDLELTMDGDEIRATESK